MTVSYNELIRRATENYLDNLTVTEDLDLKQVEQDLLDETNSQIEQANLVRNKDRQLPYRQTLTNMQITKVMLAVSHICRIAPIGKNTDQDLDLLAIYVDSGDNEGIYVTSNDAFRRIARKLNYGIASKEFEEVLIALKDEAPRAHRCQNRDLIAVNNGVFNYATKELLPFSPDYVFLSKSSVNYNPHATNVNIHNDDDGTDWDVESWMSSLSDDEEIINSLWEIMGAIIRPQVRWNKSAWFYSEVGNNGKGTLCELMRNLTGASSYASIPIADFGKDFLLEPLTRASAVIVDENDVGVFIDRAANLKAVITNDVIQINRKFKAPIAYQFYGFMVQCLNEFPRIKDKSESFYRRQLFIPFEKTFTGIERRYIKDDYLSRTEVLEYVLKRVLHMNYYVLSEPEASKVVLDEYREFNDPVREFWNEFSDKFVWDLLPFTFLWDLYQNWFKETRPNGQQYMVSRPTFIKDLIDVATRANTDWLCQGKDKKIRSANKMDAPEPLIGGGDSYSFELDGWVNQSYSGNDPKKRYKITPSIAYRGIYRNPQNLNHPTVVLKAD